MHPVDPWVPIVPGVPITSLSREGDDVRAFSPGRSHYVLAASGIDYGSPQQGDAWGLLVVDIASGTASEIRVDRHRFRFAEPDDIDAAWIDYHFVWRRDAAGRERLEPRDRFTPWPWRARVRPMGTDAWQLDVPRIDHAFVAILKTRLQTERGVRVTDTSGSGDPALAVTLDGCLFGEPGGLAAAHIDYDLATQTRTVRAHQLADAGPGSAAAFPSHSVRGVLVRAGPGHPLSPDAESRLDPEVAARYLRRSASKAEGRQYRPS